MPDVTAQHGLYRRVERRIPALARQMVDAFVAEIPLYGRLPREQLEGEITRITEDNLRLFFRCLQARRAPTVDEIGELRSSAARRAQERVPLEDVLTAYHVGTRIGWEALLDVAGPEEQGELHAAVTAMLGYLQRLSAVVAAAYLDERQAIHGEERDARRALAQALLSGAPAAVLARRAAVALAPAYAAVALEVPEHPDEHQADVSASVAARRKLRRLQARLDERAGEPVLGLLDSSGGLVLLPACPDRLQEVLDGLPGLVAELSAAAGGPVTAGAAVAETLADVPSAGQQAREVADLARRLGRPPGTYTVTDLLVEYQLSRSPGALPLLASRLDALNRNADLRRTLECYLQLDTDRRRTAAELHVHPNTLDYRLRRIVDLTGLDPGTTTGLQTLSAALTARKLLEVGAGHA